MAIQSSKKGQIFNEINITPLTDIFLVLLIIMMVIAPMFQSIDNNIKLPEINSGLTVEQESKAIVAISRNAQFYLNGTPINPENLETQLSSIVGIIQDKNIVIKADAQTKNKEIMKVMKAAKAAGFEKLTVAGEPLSKRQQADLEKNSELDNSSLPTE